MELVKLLLPHQSKKHFVQKILDAKLPSHYCLITLTLFEKFGKSVDNCNLNQRVRYIGVWENLKSHFLQELFTLFLADEPFFNEYTAETERFEWTFDEFELLSKLCEVLAKETSNQKAFNFTKSLLLHGFSDMLLAQPSSSLLLSHMGEHLLNVFVPLSNFVHAPIALIWIFGSVKIDCRYNFNESENCINDYHKLVERKSNNFEVVSLKNLARMSVRKCIFESCTHLEALSMIYSLDIPMELRQFLCYNYSNLKF